MGLWAEMTPAHTALMFAFVDGAAEVVVLDMKENGESAPHAILPLGEQLRLDLRCLYCGSEPTGEPGGRFLWRFRRRDKPYCSQKSSW
jgi:hypothetical protein